MNYQSGKTQAIDLDELNVSTANRPKENQSLGRIELDNWGGADPWRGSEESRRRRRWAEDDRWAGDDDKEVSNSAVKQDVDAQLWKSEEDPMLKGWNAPKRGEVLEAGEGWEDWGGIDGPLKIEMDTEGKEFGGVRRMQAANLYESEDDRVYAEGRQKRQDIYKRKEASSYGADEAYRNDSTQNAQEQWGTSSLRERSGDPYASAPNNPLTNETAAPEAEPEMISQDNWGYPAPGQAYSPNQSNPYPDEFPKETVNLTPAVSELPAHVNANLIIFGPDGSPTTVSIKTRIVAIGRALDNTVVLNDPYVSRKHVHIEFVNNRFELIALNRENITSVNGYPISHCMLMHQDLIEIGSTRLKFVFGNVSQALMTNSVAVNGEPHHLLMPPDSRQGFLQNKKNVIILISVSAVLILSLIVGIVLIVVSSSSDDNAQARESIADSEQALDETQETKKAALEDPKDVQLGLSDDDKIIADAMSELMALSSGQLYKSKAQVYGESIEVSINSTPEGALIYNFDNSLRGKTPYKGSDVLLKDSEQVWVLKLEGYADKSVTVDMGGNINLNEKLTPMKVEAPVVAKPAAKKPAAKKPAARKPATKKPAAKKPSTGGKRVVL